MAEAPQIPMRPVKLTRGAKLQLVSPGIDPVGPMTGTPGHSIDGLENALTLVVEQLARVSLQAIADL